MRTLIAKELRENFKWLLVGLAIMLTLAYMAVPKKIQAPDSTLLEYLGFAGALFAMALGLMQSIWDFGERQKGFLFHRAVDERGILVSKIASGATIYAVALAIPLVLVAVYYAMVGLQQLPVRPLQLVAPALLVTLCYLFHPITIMMIRRSARWYGTKLFPIAVPIFICFSFYLVCDNSWYCWLVFILSFIALASIPLSEIGMFGARIKGVQAVVGAFVVAAAGVYLAHMFAAFTNHTLTTKARRSLHTYGIDDQGILWNVKYEINNDSTSHEELLRYISGSPILPGKVSTPDGKLPEHFRINHATSASTIKHPAKRFGDIRKQNWVGHNIPFWDERGYLLIYDNSKNLGLVGITSRDGFEPGIHFGAPFSSRSFGDALTMNRLTNNTVDLLPWGVFGDSQGVYLLNQSNGDIEQLVEGPIISTLKLLDGFEVTTEFIVERDRAFEHYEFTERVAYRSPHDAPYSRTSKPVFTKIAEYPRLPLSDVKQWKMARSPNGTLAAFGWDHDGCGVLAKLLPTEKTQWKIERTADVLEPTRPLILGSLIGCMPPVLSIPTLAIASGYFASQDTIDPLWNPSDTYIPNMLSMILLFTFLCTVTSVLLVSLLLRRRCDTRTMGLKWLLLTIPLGLAAPLALIAAHSKFILESCPKCDRKRRVDRNKCEHCGSSWEPLPSQGVEILESQRFQNLASVD